MPEIPASHRDLLDGGFATLATIGPDGRPQLSEVWFLADGDTVALSLNTTRQKVKNLRANPAANVFLLDLAVPYRYLELRGDAEITPDDDYSFADQLGAKYQADLRTRDHPGESRVKVTIHPTRINAADMRLTPEQPHPRAGASRHTRPASRRRLADPSSRPDRSACPANDAAQPVRPTQPHPTPGLSRVGCPYPR